MSHLEQVQLQVTEESGPLARGLELREPWNVVAGAWLELRGRVMVAVGRMRSNSATCATGWRFQLIGMHQRWWREDRETIEARLDDWFARNAEWLLPSPGRAHQRIHPMTGELP